MKILALEFSSGQRSVAVLDTADGRVAGAAREMGNRTTKAFALIEEALRAAGCEREQIECLALGLGPGSYTGIRVAIAVAQGWQLARGVKLLGVSSADCVAAELQRDGARGRVHVVIDAQRQEFYLATYDLTAAGTRASEPLRLATLPEVQARAASGGLVAGPEATRWFPQGRVIFPDAATLATLAAARTDFIAGEQLEPIYLREMNYVKAPPPRVI